MKNLIFPHLLFFAIILFSCENEKNDAIEPTNEEAQETYAVFGDTITAEGAITAEDLLAKYQSLTAEDTAFVKFKGTIDKVCQSKGCWMSITLPEDQSVTVRFKDYGFFMPFNAGESEAIVNGMAFLNITSVEDLIARAEENNASEEEIAEITSPVIRFAFEADGVLIKEQ